MLVSQPPAARQAPVAGPAGVSFSAAVPRVINPKGLGTPVGEVVRDRTATGRVVRNSNGSMSVQEATAPINYRTAHGWSPIDNTLHPISGGWLGTDANAWTVAFGQASAGLRLDTSAGKVSVTPVGASGATPAVDHRPNTLTGLQALSPVGAVSAPSVVRYTSVWPGVDVRDTVRSGGVAEDLVLRDATAASNFTFAVGGASLAPAPGGGLSFAGPLGQLFAVTAPVVTTAAGTDVTVHSGARYRVDGSRLIVSLSQRWLRSLGKSEFPVTIDPVYTEVLPDSAVSYPNSGSAVSGNPVQVGVSGSTTWRAGLYFSMSTYQALGSGYQVYDAQLQFPGFNCSCSTPASSPLKVYNQHGAPSSYTDIGASPATLVEGPWNGPNLEVGADVNGWLHAGTSPQWFGVSADTTASNTYSVVMLDIAVYLPPAPSQVVNLANNAVLATTTPTLVAAQIPANPDDSYNYQTYNYQITTGPSPGLGLVINSGALCQNTTGQSNSSCTPGNASVPSWTVPAGVLSEGVTYHAWVLTDWFGNSAEVPQTIPALSSGVAFTVRLGLGSGGASPTDQIGSVPGQTSTPSQGAPNPGLPGSKETVNLVNGNLSFSVGTPTLSTVGGGLALGFTYNSLSATSQTLNQGLQGIYYNDTNGDDVSSDPIANIMANSADVTVGTRVDPVVNFDWGSSGGVAAQQSDQALTRWTGSITLPYTGTWALGAISSDGTNISYNGLTVLPDWGPHAAQAAPTFGTAFSVASVAPTPIQVDWHHSSSQPAVEELFAEYLGTTPYTIYQVPAGWLTHSQAVLPAGWTLNADAGSASWVGLTDHGTSVTAYQADGSGYEFINAGGGNYTAPVQDPSANLRVDGTGKFVLDDGSSLIYTFNSTGSLASVKSAADDQHPAALNYTYSGTSPPFLTSIADPVSNRTTNLYYGGDSHCPNQPGYFEPPNLLCAIVYWDTTPTNLYYNSANELVAVINPGFVAYGFAYDSNGRMNAEEDPLAVDAAFYGTRTDCGTNNNCYTAITYDTSGRVSTVRQPAPLASQDNSRPERGYCYGNLQASIGTFLTANCASPVPGVTSVAVAGLSPASGYAQLDSYDNQNRITQTCSSAGLCTHYLWNSANQLVSTTNPDGTETSAAYDSQSHPVTSYGPAPSTSFQANGQPTTGSLVPTASTQYDGGMSGLAAAWYQNPTLSGSPAYHALAAPSESWSGGNSPSSGTNTPNLIPSSGFSGSLKGLVTLPTPGRVSFNGDGGTVSIDGHQVLNQAGGPYPAAVNADGPGDFWRLGEGSGTTVAADSTGLNPGTYMNGVTTGSSAPPIPLADGNSTYAAFNGSSGTVKVLDSPNMEFSNTQSFSVEALVKTSDTTAGVAQEIASKMLNAAPNQGWEFLLYGGLPCLLLINSTLTSNYIDVCATTSVATGTWQHLAVTYNGSSNASGVKFYIDGAPATSGTPYANSLSATTVSTAPLYIGSRANSYGFFNGDLADVALYPNLSLSAARVAAHYAAAAQTSTTSSTPVIYNTPYPEAVNAASPTAYWRLGETTGSTSAADSWGSANGTYANVTLGQAGGLVGDPATSASFNGTTSTVSIPDSQNLQFNNTQPFSISARVQTMSTAVEEIVSKMANATPYQGWELVLSGGEPCLYLINSYPSNLILVCANTSVATGAWQHVAVTYNGSSTAAGVQFYINGNPVASTTSYNSLSATSVSTAPLYIGSRADSFGFFNGKLSDVALYRAALSAPVVAAQYNAGSLSPYPTAVEADTPISFWRLGDPVGSTTAADSSGPNPGIYGPSGQAKALTEPLIGDPTNAATFNGTNESVSVFDNAGLEFSNTQPFSIDAWVNTSDTTTLQAIASKMANDTTNQGWEFALYQGLPCLFLINNWSSSNAIDVCGTSNVATSSWVHLAVTYNGSSNAAGVQFYINGRPAVSGTPYVNSLTATTVSSVPFYIGSRAGSAFYFNGDLADVALYGSQLTSAQVGVHYQASQTVPGPGPNANVHQIAVTDQQFATNGLLNLTTNVSGASFDPNYGLATQSTDADGKVTSTSYANPAQGVGPQFGLVTSSTLNPGGLNLTSSTSYETPGPGSYLRVTAKTLPAGNATTYVNFCGYPTAPTCASPQQSGAWATACGVTSGTSQYGLVAQKTDPAPATGAGNAIVTQYLYDQDGRQVGLRTATVSTLASASWTCTAYDAAGRITSESSPAFAGQPAITRTYTYTVGNNPLVNSVTDSVWGSSSITSTVDLLDRVISYTDIYANTTTTTYNQAGQETATSGPQGTVSSGYDASGRPSTTALGATTLATSGYYANGQLGGITYGNGAGESLYYDANGRPYANVIYGQPSVTGEVDTLSAAGRVAKQDVYANGAFTYANGSNPEYTYDGAGRITQAVLPGVTYNYGFGATSGCTANSAGQNTNRTTLVVTGTGAGTTNYCYDNADRLNSTSAIASGQILYDTHGNTTQEGNQSLIYNAQDQLIESASPTNVTLYQRDPLKRVAQQTSITPIVEKGTTTNTALLSSTIVLSRPSSTQSGDALVAAISASSQSNFIPPAGWSMITHAQNGNGTTFVLWHLAAASDPPSWTFNVNSSTADIVGGVGDYHNTIAGPIDVYGVANDASATTQPLPQVTTSGYAETLVHVVGYNGDTTGSAPAGDSQRMSIADLLASLEVSDRLQPAPGLSAPVSASASSAQASEVFTIALVPAAGSTQRLGYTGETDGSGFTQSTSGSLLGVTIGLAGGASYATAPGGSVMWSYTNLHGDTITTLNNSGNLTWSGYWGPYGENASGTTPANTALTGATYGSNGTQGKLTNIGAGIILMGARPYQYSTGRFLQIDPDQGGCANPYTYAFGDPLNHPDLSGQSSCPSPGFWGRLWNDTGGKVVSYVASHAGPLTLIVGGALVLVIGGALTGGALDFFLAALDAAEAEGGLAPFEVLSHAGFVLAPGATVAGIGGAAGGYGVWELKNKSPQQSQKSCD